MIPQFSTLIAMVNPVGGAAGGLVFLVLFGVGPISLIIHLASRRFVLTSLGVSGAFTLSLLLMVVIFDWNVPERLYLSLHLVFVGGILCLVMTFLTGLPVLFVRLLTARKERCSNR